MNSPFTPINIQLRNGQVVLVRAAVLADAGCLLRCKQQVMDESAYMPYAPGEYDQDEAQERHWIQTLTKGANCLILVAVENSNIVGSLELKAGDKLATQHTAALSIGIINSWQGAGLGKALMALALQWSQQQLGLEIVNLEVFEDNIPAMKLYDRLGFQIIGKKERFIKRPSGNYQNILLMSLRLK